MPRLLHILLLLLLPIMTRPCHGQKSEADTVDEAELVKAAILSTREKAVDPETIRRLAEGASVQVSKDETEKDMVRYTVEWKSAKVLVHVKEDYDQKVQNEGALGWISRFPKEDLANQAAEALRKFIPTVKRTYGIVLPGGFDSGGVSTSFLLRLAGHVDGRIFWENGFYDPQGFRILGLPHESPVFGRRGGSLLTPLSGKTLRPEDFLPGVWDEEAHQSMQAGELQLRLHVVSVIDYKKDGSYTTEGTFHITSLPADGGEPARVSADFSTVGHWKIGKENQVVTDEKFKTGKLLGQDPLLRGILDEVVSELSKDDSEPEENWLISRDPDTVFLQERELGIVSQLKRRKSGKTGKAEG